jgi:hypothetical protein
MLKKQMVEMQKSADDSKKGMEIANRERDELESELERTKALLNRSVRLLLVLNARLC